MKKESGYLWRPVVGVLAIGLLAFGLSLQGAALHQRGVVSSDQAVVSVPIEGTLAAAAEVEEPGGKVTGHFAATLDDDTTAMLVVEDPTARTVQGERGGRADDCTEYAFLGGDDCADITNPTLVSGRTCTVSGVPCLFDAECTGGGGDVCDTSGIVYLSGNMLLATRQGACSVSATPCEYDDMCPEGVCTATTTGCHSHADCPTGICSTSGADCHLDTDCLTGGLDVCEGGSICTNGETCENLPCSISPQRRCTTDPPGGEQPTGFGCDPLDPEACEAPRVCVHGDRGWWEGFVLDDCSNLAVSYCCDGPQWVYGALYTPDSCAACETAYGDSYTDFEICDDSHRTFYYYGLPPGTYYQPIYAAGDPDDDGIFQLRLDAQAARGVCCTGALFDTCTSGFSPCACEAIGGAYLGDGGICAPNPCLQPGACCGSNGIGCVEVTGGSCVTTHGGYFAGPRVQCEEACCEVPATGADNCALTTPKTVPVPGYATFFGNSSTATIDCTLTDDEVWFESFTIEECAEVLVDYCCTETDYGWIFWVLVDDDTPDCCDGTPVFYDEYAERWGGTLPNCSDDNFRMLFYELTPGTYYIILHAGSVDEGLRGEYFVHVTTTALDPTETGACCVPGPSGPECVPNTCLTWCTELGGTWLAEGSCEPDPCQLGACCTPTGGCSDTTYDACSAPDLHHPGILCTDFRCPTWGQDECASAELISMARGSQQIQGYNAHATARWGLCGTSGAVCLSSNGLDAWDASCGMCEGTSTRCQFDKECAAGTCSTSGASCHHDVDCPVGSCSTTGLDCHSTADCSSTNGFDVCVGGETCVGAVPCNPTGESCLRNDPFADPYFSCSWRTASEGLGNPPDIGMNTVWYKFVALEPSIAVETCSSGLEDPSLLDTALVLYEGTCGNLTELTDDDPDFDGCGEDECPFDDPSYPYYSQICYCGLAVGSTYYLEVINSGHVPGQYQLDIEYPCADCLPGACCEMRGNRCFNYWSPFLDPDPVSTAGCMTDADCVPLASTCGGGGQCICLPDYECNDDIWPENCDAANQRYGGNSTKCNPDPEFPQIDPACGLGACCAFNDTCGEAQSPIECVGGISDGDSTWLGEGSECSDPGPFDDLECPTACPMNAICHPDLGCTTGYGHPYGGAWIYLADSTSNGICSTSGTPCDGDVDCLGDPDLCLGENLNVVADSFIPLDTNIDELCWRGMYRTEAGADCSTNLISGPDSTFTIRFWEDEDCDGLPGDAAGTGGLFAERVNVTAARSLTGFTPEGYPGGPHKEWEYHANFAAVAVVPEDCYFVEIAATNSPADCDFWMRTSNVGDQVVAFDTNANGIYDVQAGNPVDLAWLMNIDVKADDCLPSNDACVVVTAGAGTNGLSHGARESYETIYAGTDGPFHPKDRCGIGGLGNWTIENDIWYTYTAECTGTLTVDICTSGYDTMLAVYNFGGGVGTSGGWVCPTDETYLAACNNDTFGCGGVGTSGVASQVTPSVTQGDKMLIRVGGYDPADRGCGLLKLDLVPDGAEPCFEDVDCEDSLYCNGTDTCNQSTCQCEHSGDPCPDDGLYCNGDESCVEAGDVCTHGGDPCAPDPCIEETDTCLQAETIESAQSCQDHGATEYCLSIGEGGARDNNVEPRLQLGIPLELEFTATGNVASNGVTLTVSCTPPPGFAGTATVVTDGSTVGRVVFSEALPNKSCCTLTFSGDIEDCWPIAILEGDVNKDCQVSSPDSSSVKARLTDPVTASNYWYDVNRDGFISSTDRSSVKARLQDTCSCPCNCP